MALDNTIALTSKRKFRQFTNAPVDETEDDDQLDQLINGVSQRVAELCDRIFQKREYRLWLNGTGSFELLLPQFPVTNLFRVTTSWERAAEVRFTGADEVASISVRSQSISSTGNIELQLFTINTSGDTVQNNFDISTTNKTLAVLETAIEGVSGWSMTIDSGEDNKPSRDIRPFQGAHAKNEFIDLDMPFESIQAEFVDVSQRMIRLTGTNVFRTDRNNLLFPRGRNNIFVHFEAGFDLPAEGQIDSGNVPRGLELVINQIIKDIQDMSKQDTSVTSESLADHRISLSKDVIHSAVNNRMKDIEPYMKKSL